MQSNPKIPDAEILISTGCAHCPAVLAGLSELAKQGLLGQLTVINVANRPEAATARGARSVPWLRIGPFVLEGRYTPKELREWTERAGSGAGMAEYFSELLENQQLPLALELTRRELSQLETLVDLVADLETPMGVRIGVAAMFEDLAGSGELQDALPRLLRLTRAPESQVRADAAYYIGLLGPEVSRAHLQPLLNDENAEVREIVREALETAEPPRH